MRLKRMGLAVMALLVLLVAGLVVQRARFEPIVLDRAQIEAIVLGDSMVPPEQRGPIDMVLTSRARVGQAGQCQKLDMRVIDMVRPNQHYYNLCNASAQLWIVTLTDDNGAVLESSIYGANGEHIVTQIRRRIEVL